MCGKKEGKQGLRPEGDFLESIQLVSGLQLFFFHLTKAKGQIEDISF